MNENIDLLIQARKLRKAIEKVERKYETAGPLAQVRLMKKYRSLSNKFKAVMDRLFHFHGMSA